MDNLLAMDIVKTEVFESNWASGEGVKFEAVRIESNHWESRRAPHHPIQIYSATAFWFLQDDVVIKPDSYAGPPPTPVKTPPSTPVMSDAEWNARSFEYVEQESSVDQPAGLALGADANLTRAGSTPTSVEQGLSEVRIESDEALEADETLDEDPEITVILDAEKLSVDTAATKDLASLVEGKKVRYFPHRLANRLVLDYPSTIFRCRKMTWTWIASMARRWTRRRLCTTAVCWLQSVARTGLFTPDRFQKAASRASAV